MFPDNRPLETLAAHAIAFVSGMLAASALSAYAGWVRRTARSQSSPDASSGVSPGA